jgi:radical SAM protein with 4Fe4S-binding SPASM domain
VRFDPKAQISPDPLPSRVKIEVSSKCNLDCVECHRVALTRPQKLLKLDAFRTLLRELKPARLNLTGYGEPLLNRNLPAMVEEAKAFGVGHVRFFTNGTLLSQVKAERLVQSGLDWLNVSIDSPDEKTYAEIRVGANLQQVLRGVETLLRERRRAGARKPTVAVKCVLLRETAVGAPAMVDLCASRFAGEVEPEFLMFESAGIKELETLAPVASQEVLDALVLACDRAEFHGFYSTVLNLRRVIGHLGEKYSGTNLPCFHPIYNWTVTADGDAIPCQLHYNGQLRFGNILNEGAEAVWNSTVYRGYRNRIRRSRSRVPVCEHCTDAEEGYNVFGVKPWTVS